MSLGNGNTIPGAIIGFAGKGIASGIGLASESITAYKENKRTKKARGTDGELSRSTSQTYISEQDEHEPGFEERDEDAWALDEAQDELAPQATDAEEPPKDIKKVVDQFLWKHPVPQGMNLATMPRLSLPVIIPQRRPKDRTRGFIRAYAPILEDRGIDETTFLAFLDTFDKASEASPWLNAINLAGLATFALPHLTAALVGAAITISVKAAKNVQSRIR